MVDTVIPTEPVYVLRVRKPRSIHAINLHFTTTLIMDRTIELLSQQGYIATVINRGIRAHNCTATAMREVSRQFNRSE